MPRPPQNPLHLYPESPQKLHPNVQLNAPRHGLTAEYFSWSKPKETTRPVCPPPQSGKSVYFCGTNSFEGVAAQCAAGGAKRPPQGSTQRGNPSGRFFGDFLIGEKVTRVQGGAPALEEQGLPSLQNPPGVEGRSALPIGVVGAQPPLGWSAEEGVSPPRIGGCRDHRP